MAKKVKDMLIYKGKPLLREDDKLYYGDFSENFITVFTITQKSKIKDLLTSGSKTLKLSCDAKEKAIFFRGNIV